jgi:hypothetical protein
VTDSDDDVVFFGKKLPKVTDYTLEQVGAKYHKRVKKYQEKVTLPSQRSANKRLSK